jgi:type II secretory pathway pseudopilin PulG
MRNKNAAVTVAGALRTPRSALRTAAAFTMIEIAICLAIIGFALVAIIGVLPYGMNTQRDNREETVINQDATVLIETIRSAARGADNLTNSVYAIVNTGGNPKGYLNPTLANTMNFSTAAYPGIPANQWYSVLTNGANIIGLLSTPEFIDISGNPANALNYSVSNHITAYVASISGLAAEKPPQNNGIMVGDAFSYRVYYVNAPIALDTNNLPLLGSYGSQLAANQHELRLTFLWPQLPNGNVGGGRQTFRTTVAGQLSYQPNNNLDLYFYRSQFFTNNLP